MSERRSVTVEKKEKRKTHGNHEWRQTDGQVAVRERTSYNVSTKHSKRKPIKKRPYKYIFSDGIVRSASVELVCKDRPSKRHFASKIRP